MVWAAQPKPCENLVDAGFIPAAAAAAAAAVSQGLPEHGLLKTCISAV